MGYPNNPTTDEKDAAASMLRSLLHLLPCSSCRVNYAKELQMYPPEQYLECAEEFVKYINILQNSVASRLDKKQHNIEEAVSEVYQQAIKNNHQEAGRGSKSGKVCPNQYWHLIWIVLLVMMVTAVSTWAVTQAVTSKKYNRRFMMQTGLPQPSSELVASTY